MRSVLYRYARIYNAAQDRILPPSDSNIATDFIRDAGKNRLRTDLWMKFLQISEIMFSGFFEVDKKN